MASRIPLVINNGQIEQLQPGDTLSAVLTGLGAAVTPGGRLTLASGDPLTSSDQTAKTTVYYTPYLNSFISLYDSGTWTINTFTEKSVAVPSTTNTPFDVFGYLSAGDLALETVNWTNDTTRATALDRQDGFRIKSGDATRLYLGTCRTTGTSQNCEDSKTKRFVWNYYNQRQRLIRYAISDTGYTYSTNTYRSANASTSHRISFVAGLAEAYLELNHIGFMQSSVADFAAAVGLGLDSTSVNAAVTETRSIGIANAGIRTKVVLRQFPTIGGHFVQALEAGAGIGTQTWFNDADGGIDGFIEG